jgi:hypothetical protein
MKIYAIDRNERTHDSLRISQFHYHMFHGILGPQAARVRDRATGEMCLNITRNVHKIPSLFMILSNLVVSEAVKDALRGVPHLHFRPVVFSKLVDYPYQAGEFSPDPEFGNLPFARPVDFLLGLPAARGLQHSVGPYFELEAPSHAALEEHYPDLDTVVCRMRRATTPKMKLRLSKEMLTDYPVLWWDHFFFRQDMFGLIEEYFNWDYFEKSELILE